MTLIAAFNYDDMPPILLGDILLSKIKAAKPGDLGAPTPLVGEPNRAIPVGKALSITNFAQKLVIVHPHMCVAWANDKDTAIDFIEALGEMVAGKDAICPIEIARWLKSCEDALRPINYIVCIRCDDGAFELLSDLPDRGKTKSHPRYVGGSGEKHLLDAADRITDQDVPAGMAPYVYLSGRVFDLAGDAISSQKLMGEGISEGWGGGFEIAFFDGQQFQKLPYLTLYWHIRSCIGGFELHVADTSAMPISYQFYPDEDTYVVNKYVGRKHTELFVVTPPGGSEEPRYALPSRVKGNYSLNVVHSPIGVMTYTEVRAEGFEDIEFEIGDQFKVWHRAGFFKRFVEAIEQHMRPIRSIHLWTGRFEYPLYRVDASGHRKML